MDPICDVSALPCSEHGGADRKARPTQVMTNAGQQYIDLLSTGSHGKLWLTNAHDDLPECTSTYTVLNTHASITMH
jgi:hypothetical protein